MKHVIDWLFGSLRRSMKPPPQLRPLPPPFPVRPRSGVIALADARLAAAPGPYSPAAWARWERAANRDRRARRTVWWLATHGVDAGAGLIHGVVVGR
ncbi:hypothetical protein G3I76_24105 [Streptomyces sp. SID11233]|uniref:hypothetical protein n=1 Tax=unclassified Streptomyces TaxID=2593676 RepID=UPI0013BFDFAD|nr:hypothetical protein [Streptomyces sp. SID11233]